MMLIAGHQEGLPFHTMLPPPPPAVIFQVNLGSPFFHFFEKRSLPVKLYWIRPMVCVPDVN